jgi:hypothetical protein
VVLDVIDRRAKAPAVSAIPADHNTAREGADVREWPNRTFLGWSADRDLSIGNGIPQPHERHNHIDLFETKGRQAALAITRRNQDGGRFTLSWPSLTVSPTARLIHRPRSLSDNDSPYVSDDLSDKFRSYGFEAMVIKSASGSISCPQSASTCAFARRIELFPSKMLFSKSLQSATIALPGGLSQN